MFGSGTMGVINLPSEQCMEDEGSELVGEDGIVSIEADFEMFSLYSSAHPDIPW